MRKNIAGFKRFAFLYWISNPNYNISSPYEPRMLLVREVLTHYVFLHEYSKFPIHKIKLPPLPLLKKFKVPQEKKQPVGYRYVLEYNRQSFVSTFTRRSKAWPR